MHCDQGSQLFLKLLTRQLESKKEFGVFMQIICSLRN